MIPNTILRKLAGLRRRERLLQLIWGVARVGAIVIAIVLLGGLIDYLVDRKQETPWGLRYGIFYTQIAVAIIVFAAFLMWPFRKRLPNDKLALLVEEKTPELHQRLISAVQLNRPGAFREGMSEELIAVVTKEAEDQVQKLSFSKVADHRRLGWSVMALLPVVALAAGLYALWPEVVKALFDRQLLADVEIPRKVKITTAEQRVLPQGEAMKLTVDAVGADEDSIGYLQVAAEGQPTETYPLELITAADGDKPSSYEAVLPPFLGDFKVHAYLGDGRLKKPGSVKLVPRPVVVEQSAWVQLPKFCGLKPNGLPYEQPQPRGEVVGIGGSSVRVQVKIQKPVQNVQMEVLTREGEDEKGPETTLKQVAMKPLHHVWRTDLQVMPVASAASAIALASMPEAGPWLAAQTLASACEAKPQDGHWAEAIFELKPGITAYKIHSTDEYGFVNQPAPRRALRIVPEDPPVVSLLPESFQPPNSLLRPGDPEEYQVDGLPIIPGAPIKVGYIASGPYGLGHANLMYRVIRKRESGNDDAGDEKWLRIPLPEVVAGPNTGPFDPRRGLFVLSGDNDSIGFHAIPSPDPYSILGRTLAGGRWIFKTTGLRDENFGKLDLKVGDQIEYCVEIHADKDPGAGRPYARSESRLKTVVSLIDLASWMQDVLQEERRIRSLDAQQRLIFEGKK